MILFSNPLHLNIQPLSPPFVFNLKMTTKAFLVKTSSLLLHVGHDLLTGHFPADGERRGGFSLQSPLKASYWAKCSYIFPTTPSLPHTCNHFFILSDRVCFVGIFYPPLHPSQFSSRDSHLVWLFPHRSESSLNFVIHPRISQSLSGCECPNTPFLSNPTISISFYAWIFTISIAFCDLLLMFSFNEV